MGVELKPCPFCGAANPILASAGWSPSGLAYVRCADDDECGAEGPCRTKNDDAITAWNSRSSDAAAEARGVAARLEQPLTITESLLAQARAEGIAAGLERAAQVCASNEWAIYGHKHSLAHRLSATSICAAAIRALSVETLPPGFRVLNDGPGREVLVDDRTDEPAPVFSTREKAIEAAWRLWREIYEPEQELKHTIHSLPHDPIKGNEGRGYQPRVMEWLLACFGPGITNDRVERVHRFWEEALELGQSAGCTASEAHQLVDYVFGRPTGELSQEIGGTMVCLAALCAVHDIDMQAEGERELARVWTKVEKIRAKHAAKPRFSPLPGQMDTADAATTERGDG